MKHAHRNIRERTAETEGGERETLVSTMDDNVSANTVLVLILAWALRIHVAPLLDPSSRRSRALLLLLLKLMSVEAVDAPIRAQLERRLKLTKDCGDQVMGVECPLFCQGAGRVQHANFVPSRYFQGECFLVNTFVGLCNPGSTRDLQQLILLSFVACSTRWVGARFDGEPSKREVLLQAGPESTVIYMSARNGIARLSVTRIYGDSTTIFSTTRHDIQHLWNGYRSYKSSREDMTLPR